MSQLRAANIDRARSSSIYYRRQRLFHPITAFEIPLQDFAAEWKLGDNFWTQYNNTTSAKTGKQTISYKCKFVKHRKSSGKRPDKENCPQKKRRLTSVFTKVECPARLDVVIDKNNNLVTIRHAIGHTEHSEGHDIADADDRHLCSHASDYIKDEAESPYAHADIAKALPVIIMRATSPARVSALGLDRVSARAVYNARWRERREQAAPPGSLAEDVKQAIEYLTAEGYIVKRLLSGSDGRADEGFTFAVKESLSLLPKCSYLVLLDSTHKTNRYDWRLFTCMIRNQQGSWLPAAQFFVSNENGDAVALGLQQVREMVEEVCGVKWQPRNIQVDQSNIEKNGILLAFPGMYAGEEEVKVRYCKVHVARTLMRRLATHKPTYAKMLQALDKTTIVCATALLREAITDAPEKLGNYLESYWANPAVLDCWTMAARQHSPTLLQMTSTNPLESYHRLVKADRNCGKFSSIQKACVGLSKVNIQRRLEADRAEVLFKSKVLKDTEDHPNIGRFPLPVQRLLIEQYNSVENRVVKGKLAPDYDTLECNCLFARQYLLPCKHAFHANLFAEEPILTDEVWDRYAQMFDECGFEVYETISRVPVEREEGSPVDIYRDYRKRQVKEADERLLNHYFRLEDKVTEGDPLATERLLQFIERLQTFVTEESQINWTFSSHSGTLST
ncbi:hypothetical protein DFS34DRAFT_693860 [Phlyctochytrium arcticum]|nr:hypothetical protein DFS34DRAFT_693860 [Phlyctochytrium arcticum]